MTELYQVDRLQCKQPARGVSFCEKIGLVMDNEKDEKYGTGSLVSVEA